MHWNGAAWTWVSGPPTTHDLWAVFGFSPTDVWVGGDNLYHYDGTRWTATLSPPDGSYSAMYGGFAVIWGAASNDVWSSSAWAGGSTVVHWDGKSWKNVAQFDGDGGFACTEGLSAIAGQATNDVWASCGSDGPSLLHWNGDSWTVASFPEGIWLTQVIEPAPGELWATAIDGAGFSNPGPSKLGR